MFAGRVRLSSLIIQAWNLFPRKMFGKGLPSGFLSDKKQGIEGFYGEIKNI